MFHRPRYRAPQPTHFQKLWEWHDDHPLPDKLNRAARTVLHVSRRVRHALKSQQSSAASGGDVPHASVPRTAFLKARAFEPMRFDDASAWFQRIHEANEAVHQRNGSWLPQPMAIYAADGVSVEEVALRIPGYISAHRATNEAIYLERAIAGGDYILRERLFADGHLRLQGHLSIDFCYPLAGVALLALWDLDRSRAEYFEAARRIGDRLIECHLTGSVNHACVPAQLLGPLYRHTGERRYLKAAIRRVYSRALPFQLPSGDWDGPGYQAYVWYQSIILKSLIVLYVSMPCTLEYSGKRDRLSQAIIAATNWFLSLQNDDGSLPTTRFGGFSFPGGDREVVEFDGTQFVHSPLAGGYRGHGAYEIDVLVSMYEQLHVHDVLSPLHGYASVMEGTQRLWRLEFNTLGAGRYLGLLADLKDRPKASWHPGSDRVVSQRALELREPADRTGRERVKRNDTTARR